MTTKKRRRVRNAAAPSSHTSDKTPIPHYYKDHQQSNNSDVMVQLYRAEMILLQHHRQLVSPRLETESANKKSFRGPPSNTTTATNILKENLLSTTRSSFMEKSNGIVPKSTPHFKLLPLVSGVEFSEISLLSSFRNEDRSIQCSSYRLKGKFPLRQSFSNDTNNSSEPFMITLDVEHCDSLADAVATNPVPFPMNSDSSCRIVQVRDCCLGENTGDNKRGRTLSLWSKDEEHQFTNPWDLNNDNQPTLKSFPVWLQTTRKFVQFAHDRAHWIQQWKQRYPALFESATVESDAADPLRKVCTPSKVRPDLMQIYMPGAKQKPQPTYIRNQKAATGHDSTSDGCIECSRIVLQWSWSSKVGQDVVQVIPNSDISEDGQVKKVSSRQHQSDSEIVSLKQGAIELPTTTVNSSKIQDGIKDLTQFTAGDCRAAIDLFLAALSAKYAPTS